MYVCLIRAYVLFDTMIITWYARTKDLWPSQPACAVCIPNTGIGFAWLLLIRVVAVDFSSSKVWNVVRQRMMAYQPKEQLNKSDFIDWQIDDTLLFCHPNTSVQCLLAVFTIAVGSCRHFTLQSGVHLSKPEPEICTRSFFRSFCMYFHMNLHSSLVNIHCFCEFTPVCAKWKANGPPWRNKLIKKWSQQEQLQKVCVYPKQRCKYISSLFFSVSLAIRIIIRHLPRSECTSNFLFFEIAFSSFFLQLFGLPTYFLPNLWNIHNRLVNSNADKKPTARYEPRHCYVRQDAYT